MHPSRLLAVGVAVLALLLGSASGTWAAPRHIKVTTHGNPGHPLVIALEEMKAYIEEHTNGQYILDIYPSSKLGTMESCYQGLKFGTVHMMVEGPSNLSKFIPAFKVFDLPYLFPDEDAADDILAGPVGRKLLADSSNAAVTCLRFLHYGSRVLFTTRPVTGIDDLRGLKIRASGSAVHLAALTRMGMSPVPMPVTEIYTSLQQGVIDGTDVDIPGQFSNKWYEKANHAFLSRHIYVPHLLFVSTVWWNKLPGDVRRVLETAADQYCVRARELLLQNDIEGLRLMREDGLVTTEISGEETARWMEATRDLYREFPDIPASLMEDIRAALAARP